VSSFVEKLKWRPQAKPDYLVTRNVRGLGGELKFPHILVVTPTQLLKVTSMSALIIRLPEEKRTRLKLVAMSRKVSVTKLIEEMATILLADFDGHYESSYAQCSLEATLFV
jgi:hypothetical protein